jgi:hypothetical protein
MLDPWLQLFYSLQAILKQDTFSSILIITKIRLELIINSRLALDWKHNRVVIMH